MSPNDSATGMLRDQHQKILKIAGVLQEVLGNEAEPGMYDYDAISDCIDFIRLYADALHHGEEEDLLFVELEAAGMPRHTGPIAVMLNEHAQGRAFVKAMVASLPAAREGDVDSQGELRRMGFGYVHLIRAHILKEDNILFEVADQMMEGPTCRSLCSAYEGMCQRRFEGCTVAELEAILARLLEKYPDA